MRYGLAVTESPASLPVSDGLAQGFATNGTNIPELLFALTQLDHFLLREADADEEAPPAPSYTSKPAGASDGGAPADGGGGGPARVMDVPTTAGVTFAPQAGYENGKEEGAGNFWVRGEIRNTTATPIQNWAYRMNRLGTIVQVEGMEAGDTGAAWIIRGKGDSLMLQPNRGYYFAIRFSR